MTVSILGRRYASALLRLTEEAGATEIVRRDLKELLAAWEESRELRSVFENPGVTAEQRRRILRELAQASGMHPLLRDTLLILSDRRRMRHVPELVDSFETLAEVQSGRVRAEVITATELPSEYFAQLQRTLEQVTGKQVVVTKRVDPSIIGGLVTRIGDQVFDGSVRHQLDELKDELTR